MNKSVPSSITIEEAVALMVNLDYIPSGFSLLEMTAAFQEEAEVEYENAHLDRLPEGELAAFKLRFEACQARHILAESLLRHLQEELAHPDNSLLVVSSDSSSMTRLELESVADWASYKYGIGIPNGARADSMPSKTDEALHRVENNTAGEDVTTKTSLTNVTWNDVRIKIYKDFKIGCFIGKTNRKQSHFRAIGLMGERKNKPNHLGGILIGLSHGDKFPEGKKPKNADAVPIAKLRKALQQLTGISTNPFYPFNEGDGWKPRFKLIDDRANADDRAKKQAWHDSYDDTKNYSIGEDRYFDDQDDDA